MSSRYSQITVFVLNAINDVFTNVTYRPTVIFLESRVQICHRAIVYRHYADQRLYNIEQVVAETARCFITAHRVSAVVTFTTRVTHLMI